MLGCNGAVAGFASTAGKLMKKIAACVDAADTVTAADLQFHLMKMFYAVYGERVNWWNSGQKYALKYMGILSSATTRMAPQEDLPESQRASIRACVDANRDHLF